MLILHQMLSRSSFIVIFITMRFNAILSWNNQIRKSEEIILAFRYLTLWNSSMRNFQFQRWTTLSLSIDVRFHSSHGFLPGMGFLAPNDRALPLSLVVASVSVICLWWGPWCGKCYLLPLVTPECPISCAFSSILAYLSIALIPNWQLQTDLIVPTGSHPCDQVWLLQGEASPHCNINSARTFA